MGGWYLSCDPLEGRRLFSNFRGEKWHIFSNRNVLLGVSGGIAAYKSAELVRQLQELGAA